MHTNKLNIENIILLLFKNNVKLFVCMKEKIQNEVDNKKKEIKNLNLKN